MTGSQKKDWTELYGLLHECWVPLLVVLLWFHW